MNTNSGMKRKMISGMVLLVMIGCGPLALVTPAWGSMIAVVSVDPTPTTATYGITALGPIDWALPSHSEKANGTAIVTYVSTNGRPDGHLAAEYGTYGDWTIDPRFSYTDGAPGSSAGTSSGWLTSPYELHNGSYSATINLPANISGIITVWCATWSKDDLAVPGTFAATFADLTSTATSMPGDGSARMVTLSYSTAIAQTLTLTVTDTGDTGNAGFYGLAVAPEPASAVLLTASLLALASRNWRKRNQRAGLK